MTNQDKLKEKTNQEIWWVLQEIKKEDFATPKDKYIYFEYQPSDSFVPSREDQRRVLKILEKEEAIKIVGKKYPIPYLSDMNAEMFNIKPIGIGLDILQPKFDELYKKYKSLCSLTKQQETTKFDSLNGILISGSKTYKIQSKTRLALMRKLWEERQEIGEERGRIIKKGKSFPKEAVASNIELIESPREFNEGIKNKLKGEIRELNRIFRNKSFPLQIKTAKGIQLIVRTEK